MKQLLSFIFSVLIISSLFAQTTQNPRINWKSSQDVYINKVEITDSYTILYMQFWNRDGGQSFDDFIRENPDIARRLRQMGLSRSQAERLFKERFSTQQTISFQPSSKIVLSNGDEYGFIKAVNIPTAPDRQDVEYNQKYFFRVYFEKIPPGYELVDMLEHSVNKEGDFQYWNFRGIHINNPKDREPVQESPVPEEILTSEFRLFGRVLDAKTEEPINAKIVCEIPQSGEKIDSLQTSRSGKYEFFVNEDEIRYYALADGYEPLSESLNLKLFLKNGSFEKDIYLMPIPVKEEPVIIEEPEKEATEVTPEEDNSIGEKLDETAKSFKLDKVYFNVSKADILPESHEQLNNLAQYLLDHPKLKIEIEGHTDNRGDARANKKLSIDRAYNVRNYLVSKGVASDRIKFTGYGSTRPVAPNDTEENLSKNRRVEYKFID